jgi:hypothetical protein
MGIERFILRFGMVFGFISFFTLFKRPTVKVWLPLYLTNCLFNYLFDKVLVETKQVAYPIRFSPSFLKINVIYDLLVCPFLSIWYCQATYNSRLPRLISKLILFATPQAMYEILLERKTNALEFKGHWRWLYSFCLVFGVKILSRMMLELLKKLVKKDETNSSSIHVSIMD